MPERLQLTGSPRTAAAQLIAHMNIEDPVSREDLLDDLVRKRLQIEDLTLLNQQLKETIDVLLRINARSTRRGVSYAPRGRARRENMGTISEASLQ